MNFPIEPDTPEERLAEAIATDLAIDGFDPCCALPCAIHIMSACNKGHDDPDKGVQWLQTARKRTDEWWITNHPNSQHAKDARKRIKENPCPDQ